MTLSTRLVEARERLGSWDLVAAEVGTSTANVTRWKDGSEPKPEFYAGLMKLLGIDLDELGALVIREQIARWNQRKQ